MAELDRQRGERIRDLREASGWTQRGLADRAHVDPKTVHNWEAGKGINIENLRELAELFGCQVDYIRYGEEINMSRPPTADVGTRLTHIERQLDDLRALMQEHLLNRGTQTAMKAAEEKASKRTSGRAKQPPTKKKQADG